MRRIGDLIWSRAIARATYVYVYPPTARPLFIPAEGDYNKMCTGTCFVCERERREGSQVRVCVCVPVSLCSHHSYVPCLYCLSTGTSYLCPPALSACQSVCQPVCLPLYIYTSVYLSIFSVRLTILSACLSACLPASTCLSIYPSVCLSACLPDNKHPRRSQHHPPVYLRGPSHGLVPVLVVAVVGV